MFFFRLRRSCGLSSTGVTMRNQCVYQLSRCCCHFSLLLISFVLSSFVAFVKAKSPAPLHADARDGDGEVHDPDRDLQRGAGVWRTYSPSTNSSSAFLRKNKRNKHYRIMFVSFSVDHYV